MKTKVISDLNEAKMWLSSGETLALPAEACFGLSAVVTESQAKKIISLKQRPPSKGLILVGYSFEVFAPWINISQLSSEHLKQINLKRDRPTTFLVPKKEGLSELISGNSASVAIRITNHPILYQLSKMLNMPLISTSANPQSLAPATSIDEVLSYFDGEIRAVFQADLGSAVTPSQIIDLLSGKIVRE
ncbi:L-threonylcarbamoyladenylate synthase [Thiotrichales bacterium 19S9-12]|nr:L-threonylcarbamoyladenylate synthase [Thiotrichales bacterium 19S9-11]MCF6811470.1 L-threonylcarbamoyladenylate synthase [Thiotrichales bacterium 19S9-12]